MLCPVEKWLNPLSKEDLADLNFFAFKDTNEWWRLRKVVLEVRYKEDGCILYRQRYLTALLPKLKYRAACRRIRRLWAMEGY